MTRYGFLGIGSLATALVSGLCLDDAPEVLLSPRNAALAAALAERFATVTVAESNQAVLDGSDVVLPCLRQRDATVLAELTWRADHTVISPMPGLTVPALERLCAPAGSVARAITMPALATRSAETVVHPPVPAAVELFDLLGGTIPVDSASAYDALYTASATVAPFFAYLGAVSDWLVDAGTARRTANAHLASIFDGVLTSMKAVAEPDFDELAAEYATPGGVNEQITTLMREAGVFGHMRDAVDTVHRRLNPS